MELFFNSPAGAVLVICAALGLDCIVGDPAWLPHPVVLIGKYISLLEKGMNRGGKLRRKCSGIFLAASTVGGTYLITWELLRLAFGLNFWLGLVLNLWFLSTSLASKSLAKAGREIYTFLTAGNLEAARRKVGWIVGRDTGDLAQPEVVRATVETVAENIVDGITSPLFFAIIGGLPLAMAYKAVNTLDSMVGYKNERFADFGWAGARLDDLANLLPARLTSVILVLAAAIWRFDYRAAVLIILRDAKKHPSPNSGYAESAVAGALGIRLGGINSYGGVKSLRAFMGDPKRELAPLDILATIKVMYSASWLFLLCGIGVKLLLLKV